MTDPHLFIRESVQICTLQINSIIVGFKKTLSLYKAKLLQAAKNPFYDFNEFYPHYGNTDDKEKGNIIDRDYMRRLEKESKALQADFLKHNIKF